MRTRVPTAPALDEPPSKSAIALPASRRCIDPSPTATIVTRGTAASVPPGSACIGRHAAPMAMATATRPLVRRHHLRRNAIAPTMLVRSPSAEAGPTVPTGIDPPISSRQRSTSDTCISAGAQRSGPHHATSGGHASPTIAFGYAIASVADESGAQASVSSAPMGCTVPKCRSTSGALTRNAASEAATAVPVS